jgi:TolB protein
MLSSAPTAAQASLPDPHAAVIFAGDRLDGTGHELITLRADGTHPHRFTWNHVADNDPTWSPDGKRIAWVRFADVCNCGPSRLWIMNWDGSGRHPITPSDGTIVERPSWSPDGRHIAFTRDERIFIINADGTDDHEIQPIGDTGTGPAWSPDGSRIAFSGYTAAFDVEIFVMKLDGSGRRQITYTPNVLEERPAWSPDGGKIAATGLNLTTSWRVYVVDLGTRIERQLEPGYGLEPAWSPDGAKIMFFGCGEIDCGLYTARVDGSNLRRFGPRRFSGSEPDYR